ncbi:MAG: hypothetical protein AAGF83_22400 [Cyanobacteria bacterium P01_G01_bin.67]
MNKILTLKTILTILIGASLASSLKSFPAKASEENLVDQTTNAELILSQNFDYGDRPDDSSSTDSLNKIVGLTGLAIGTGVIGYQLARAYKPSLVNSIPAVNNSSTPIIERVSPKLRRELLRLVHNQQTAIRLLSGTSRSHPDRSPNWIAEKVIYDLKRDR